MRTGYVWTAVCSGGEHVTLEQGLSKAALLETDGVAVNIALYFEIPITLTAFVLLVGFQALQLRKVRQAPLVTSLGLNNWTRARWVEYVIAEQRDILAVQTLRNWTMAATFLASTAILLALAFLNFAVTTEKLSEVAHIANFFGSRSETLLVVKALSNVLVFLFTFFNFTLAVRYYNHVAFLINLPSNRKNDSDRANVVQTVNRGAAHYNLGMRGFFTAVPVTVWIVGPGWFLLSAVVVTMAMSRLDRFG